MTPGNRRKGLEDETSFHPQVAGTALVWVEVAAGAGERGTGTNHSPDDELLMGRLNGGAVEARDLPSGQQWI